jgi:hypothetical protein
LSDQEFENRLRTAKEPCDPVDDGPAQASKRANIEGNIGLRDWWPVPRPGVN